MNKFSKEKKKAPESEVFFAGLGMDEIRNTISADF